MEGGPGIRLRRHFSCRVLFAAIARAELGPARPSRSHEVSTKMQRRIRRIFTSHQLLRWGVADYHSARFPPDQSSAMQKIGICRSPRLHCRDRPARSSGRLRVPARCARLYDQTTKSKGATVRYVAGPELLEGVRLYALKEFGPMALTVLSHWGVAALRAHSGRWFST